MKGGGGGRTNRRNERSGALGQATLPAWERADSATQLLVEVIAILIYLVTSLLLLLQMLVRLALIDVLLVVSPIALLCWVVRRRRDGRDHGRAASSASSC